MRFYCTYYIIEYNKCFISTKNIDRLFFLNFQHNFKFLECHFKFNLQFILKYYINIYAKFKCIKL